MEFTAYFRSMHHRPDRRRIRVEWIQAAMDNPVRRAVQSDGRIRLWTYVQEEGRFLRVITLADGETVHNAFFDRSFKEEL